MGRETTLLAVREKYPQYADMTDDQLGSALAGKYPQYADLAPKTGATEYLEKLAAQTGVPVEQLQGRIESAKHRPMAMALGAGTPRNVGERIAETAASIPLIAAAGPEKGIVQGLRQVAATGGLARARGEDWPHTLIDMAGAGVGLGATGLFAKGAEAAAAPAIRETGRVAEAARVGKAAGQVIPEIQAETDKELWGAAQKWGAGSIEKALGSAVDAIKSRLGPAIRFDIPSLGKGRKTLEQAIQGYKDALPEAKAALRQEIMDALGRVDALAPKLLEEALQARAAAYTYVGTLQKSLDASGKFDPRRLAAYVNKHYKDLQTYAGKYWPKLEEAFLGVGKQAPVDIAPKPPVARFLGRPVEAPLPLAKVAEQAVPILRSGATRGAVGAVTGQPPLSAVAATAPYYLARPLLRRVPGGRELEQTVEEMESE